VSLRNRQSTPTIPWSVYDETSVEEAGASYGSCPGSARSCDLTSRQIHHMRQSIDIFPCGSTGGPCDQNLVSLQRCSSHRSQALESKRGPCEGSRPRAKAIALPIGKHYRLKGPSSRDRAFTQEQPSPHPQFKAGDKKQRQHILFLIYRIHTSRNLNFAMEIYFPSHTANPALP
jgi:hypothetical protein